MQEKKERFVRTNIRRLLRVAAKAKEVGAEKYGKRKLFRLNSSDLQVLLCLADHLSFNTPYAYVTQVKVAKELETTPECVAKSIKKLLGYRMILRRTKKIDKNREVVDKSCFVVDPTIFWRGDKSALYKAKNTTWAALIRTREEEEVANAGESDL